jgi:uncharacterized membrane protein
MTEPDQALIGRLSSDLAVISSYMARATADMAELQRIVATRAQQTTPYAAPAPAYWQSPVGQSAQPATPSGPVQPQAPVAAGPPVAPADRAPRSDGWIGKALAMAGVAVTLVGVVLLLVLAAQAGILRPEFRVGGGAVLALGLVGAGWWLQRRPGGRVGAIALAATGIAAAYIDVMALTTIYHWAPAAVGLLLAAAVAGGGLTLARSWNSENLGLLVLVPLIVLGPAVGGGVTVLVVGFMLALSAASLPVHLGKDWIGLYAARIAVATLPLLLALAGASHGSGQAVWLAAACAVAAALAIAGGLLLLPKSSHPGGMAVLSMAGTVPVLFVSAAVGRVVAAPMSAVLAVVLLALAIVGDRRFGVVRAVGGIWAASSAVAALVAVTVAFDGPVAGPVLLAIALVVAYVGRRTAVARWSAAGFGIAGAAYYLDSAPLTTLVSAHTLPTPTAVSTLISSLLVIGCAVVITWSWVRDEASRVDADVARILWASAAAVAMYAITMFTVTAGVLLGGGEAGFFSGHVAATICWIALAACVFGYATRIPRARRSLPIAGGTALVVAAMAKLFLFDLGTLDGIFRVVVFIVAGLVLLAMGAGYARMLAQQDEEC